ncbi:hypothetical protein MMC25_007388 [Agyrium rufum]|nr:hypothetical protein [Agyrium rufum]
MHNLKVYKLQHLSSDLSVCVALYKDLSNAKFLRQQLLEGNTDFEYAFIDATSVISPRHLLAAIFRAANDLKNNRIKSRNVHAEIVFALSPNNNIAESFRKFGVTDSTTNLIVVKLVREGEQQVESVAQHLAKEVEGTAVPFDEDHLCDLSDVEKIKKIYKLTAPAKNNKFRQKGFETSSTAGDSLAEREELESIILGMMALRDAREISSQPQNGKAHSLTLKSNVDNESLLIAPASGSIQSRPSTYDRPIALVVAILNHLLPLLRYARKMAASVVILSSSPTTSFIATTPLHQSYRRSMSSPFSISSPSKKNQLNAAISNFPSGFTTALALLPVTSDHIQEEKQPQESKKRGSNDDRGQVQKEPPRKRARVVRPKVSKEEIQEGELQTAKKARGRPMKNAGVPKIEGGEKERKARTVKAVKPSKNEAEGEGETAKTDAIIATADTFTVRAYSAELALTVGKAQDLGLQRAMPRKRSWTPVPTEDTNIHSFEQFTYEKQSGVIAPYFPITKPSTLTKRQSLEQVKIPNVLCPLKRSKSNPPRAQTVTGKATEAYQPEKPDNATVLEHFLTQVVPTDIRQEAPITTSTKPGAKKQPSKGKRTPKATKAKNIVNLLTPEQAISAAKHQDLIFGTSSQIAQNEATSPKFFRDLQTAIRNSQEDDLDHKSESMHTRPLHLWNAGTRNDGELLNPDANDIFNVEHLGIKLQAPPLSPKDVNVPDIPKSVAEAALRDRPKSHLPVKDLPKDPPKRRGRKKRLSENPKMKPDYETYSLADLKAAVSKFGFKQPSNRGTLLKLLDSCWKGKERQILNPLPPNLPLPSPSKTTKAASPSQKSPAEKDVSLTPKKKGKSRVKILKSTHQHPHMADPTMPTKEHAVNPEKASTEVPILPTPVSPSKTTILRPNDIEVHLFPSIARAIQTCPLPSTKDPSLTFHEKILMYDPIIIEDLAVWLKTAGLGHVGVDEEVSAKTVKAWCETNSICCLPRENIERRRR